MSQQNVQLVKSGYDAFNRGDLPAVLALYDESIEWTEGGGGRAPAGTFHGPAAVAEQVFALVPVHFDQFRAEPREFIDAGDYVVVSGRFTGSAKGGATLDTPFVHVQRLRDGRITRFQNYVDASAWAAAWA